tara:strand:+ start:817 stop:1224 length:408 start_codon:yes stop_codon:yes gene_type:complete
MDKDTFDDHEHNKKMYAHYLGLNSTKGLESWDVEFSLNDYSMKSILKKTNNKTFAMKSWLEDNQGNASGNKYWVLFGTHGLVDPFNMSPSAGDKRLKTFKFRKVDEGTFENFEKYLSTKNSLYFTKARRTAMETV